MVGYGIAFGMLLVRTFLNWREEERYKAAMIQEKISVCNNALELVRVLTAVRDTSVRFTHLMRDLYAHTGAESSGDGTTKNFYRVQRSAAPVDSDRHGSRW